MLFWRKIPRNVGQSLALRESAVSHWQGAFFLLSIGVPPLVGAMVGDMRAGIIGALTGLLLSLTDRDDTLPARLFALGRAFVMLLVCGFLGNMFAGYSTAFWLSFVVLTFLTGWLQVHRHVTAVALRYGALALVSTASLPGNTLAVVWLMLFAALLCLATRLATAYFFPRLGAVTLSSVSTQNADVPAGWRFSLIYAGVIALGLIIGQLINAQRPAWVATSALLVMQPDARLTNERIVQRVFGTLLGILLASIVIHWLHSMALLFLVIMLIAFLIPHGASRSYWLHSALTALLILVLYDFAHAGHSFDVHLFAERMRDVALGCGLAYFGTLLVFAPVRRNPAAA